MLILPSMYQSTIFGTSVRPRAPPNAEPFQTRPVTSWNGPRGDFRARRRDADDDRLAPAAMAAFQRLAHGVDVADAFEREIRAAAGEIDDRLHDLVAADLVRIDEMRHAELLGDLDLATD